jgi:gamma-glutamyltranspeptidase/glutathione hydrolase
MWTAVQALNILERFDLRTMGHNSAAALHHYVEAARHAFADRFYYLGDPEFEPMPLEGLLSDGYATALAKLIDPGETRFATTETPPAIEFAMAPLHDPWPFDGSGQQPRRYATSTPAPSKTHTTSFALADRDRSMVVCTITTGEVLGSKVTIPGTGIVLNDMMALFSPRPGTANSIAPWKRTLGSTTAPIVLRDGRPWFAMGSPGGRHIMACGQQVMMNVIDHGMSIQPAISAPRVDPVTELTTYDDRIDPAVVERLLALGHRMSPVTLEHDPFTWDFAQPTGVMVDDDGRLRAGADPWVRAEARGW